MSALRRALLAAPDAVASPQVLPQISSLQPLRAQLSRSHCRRGRCTGARSSSSGAGGKRPHAERSDDEASDDGLSGGAATDAEDSEEDGDEVPVPPLPPLPRRRPPSLDPCRTASLDPVTFRVAVYLRSVVGCFKEFAAQLLPEHCALQH